MRGRVLEALALRVKQFRSREELWPLRVPTHPIPLEHVVEHALAEAHTAFDAGSLRSRALLRLEWDDGYGWDAWVIARTQEGSFRGFLGWSGRPPTIGRPIPHEVHIRIDFR